MKNVHKKRLFLSILISAGIVLSSQAFAQKPYRVGTTTANFLEIGFSGAGNAMGDAYVSVVRDLSGIYWNPAGLAYMQQSEAQFFYQPWVADISTSFTGVGLVLPTIGTIGLGLFYTDYGDMEVTTVRQQEGTGERFSSTDFAATLSYSRQLAEWFAFGGSLKYVSSSIWHVKAHAAALDLGVIIETPFFSPTSQRKDGLNIGMSISNYGTRMKYDGLDLLNPIDILPEEQGNYRDTPGQFHLQEWELPLIFRVGVSFNPIVIDNQRITLAVDALHPNNNSESVNLGAQYQLKLPTAGLFYLRGGYKALFMQDAEFGLSMGGGMELRFMGNVGLKLDYAYRGIGILGKTHSYSVGVLF
ncbi:MAG: PorV/PorQ family protein [Deferribacteres bacterium]|nr:PorV/PorQ family protein [candidate division KSB1 bacterium]MCB9504272.1 PorV/PorQ family protein [Deferribacteres bacterium]